jgi:hypothetical protein
MVFSSNFTMLLKAGVRYTFFVGARRGKAAGCVRSATILVPPATCDLSVQDRACLVFKNFLKNFQIFRHINF